jgi:hypothetical protein
MQGSGVHWDGTVTLGNVITLVGFVVAAVGVYTRVSERLTRVEERLKFVYDVLFEHKVNKHMVGD